MAVHLLTSLLAKASQHIQQQQQPHTTTSPAYPHRIGPVRYQVRKDEQGPPFASQEGACHNCNWPPHKKRLQLSVPISASSLATLVDQPTVLHQYSVQIRHICCQQQLLSAQLRVPYTQLQAQAPTKPSMAGSSILGVQCLHPDGP